MRNVLLSLIFIMIFNQLTRSQTPGVYPGTNMVVSGNNSIILPLAQPLDVTGATATASASFKGLLMVNPATGIVTVTNAHPAGNYIVTVSVFNGNASAASSFILTVSNTGCSQGLFTPKPETGVGGLPFSIVAGDFNADGKQDIATANYGNNNISVRLGDGLGGFAGGMNIPAGISPQSLAIGDFNGDGKQDIAAANFVSFSISILMGNGAGGFTTMPDIAVGNYPYSIAAGDFNGDGKVDLATANYGSNDVSIRLGNGAGGFSAAPDVAVGNGPRSIAINDFNNDGKTDIATADYSGNTISIRMGNGMGAFSGTTVISAGLNPFTITTGDFNNDGNIDLAAANINSNNISIRMGNGLGAFSGTTEVITGTNPRFVTVNDFNGDGNLDIAVANLSSNTVSVRLGNGSGGFTGTTEMPVGNNPYALVSGDFNGDGKADIATANAGGNNVSVRLGDVNDINVQGNNISITDGNSSTGFIDHTDFGNVSNNFSRTFNIQNTGPVNLAVNSITMGGADAGLFSVGNISLPLSIPAGGSAAFTVTFIPVNTGVKHATVHIFNDNCNKADYDFSVQGTGVAVSATLGDYPATIISTGGNMTVVPAEAPVNAGNITASASAGFGGTLLVDTVTGVVTVTNARPAGSYLVTVKVNGVSTAVKNFMLTVTNTSCSQGLLVPSGNVTAGAGIRAIAVGDYNGDGKQDMLSANSEGNSVSVQFGDGTGAFNVTTVVPVGLNPLSVVTNDFNGDGKADIATANNGSNNVSVRLGDGTGAFGGATNIVVGNGPISIAISDYNGDGKQDIITANSAGNDVSIRMGDGLGNFSGNTNLPAGNDPRSVISGDFNNDGKFDFAVANYVSNNISIRLGDGLGGFEDTINVAVGANPSSLVAGDFNGDGKQDMATANNTGNDISIVMGDGTGHFDTAVYIPIGGHPGTLAVGDFNGDGKPDIAATDANNGNVYISFGNGAGGFAVGTTLAAGGNLSALAVADFNADAKDDLATGNGTGISIFLGSLNEINVQGNNISIAGGSQAVSLADHTDFGNVNSNLTRSFTIQNTGLVNLTVNSIFMSGADASLFSIGGTGFPFTIAAGLSSTFTVTFIPTSIGIKTATVNIMSNDCDEALYDFVVEGTGVVLVPMLGTYPATGITSAGGNTIVFPSSAPVNANFITAYTSSAGFKGLLSVDPATGIVNITNAHPAGTYIITVRANGILTASSSFVLTVGNARCSMGAFDPAASVGVGQLPFSVAIGDFNNDGRQDIVSADYYSNTVSIRIGNGAGGFSGNYQLPVGSNPYSVTVGDFNADGKQDVVTANYGSSSISILTGDGMGQFTGNSTLITGPLPTFVATGDFNADGKQDIVVSVLGNSTLSILLGDGAGNFSGLTGFQVESGAFSIAIGDFNADGKQDIVTANYNLNTASVYFGNGAGNFSWASSVNVGLNPYSVAVGDFNADGKSDIVTANYGNNTVSVLFGNGAGNFSASSDIPVGNGPGSIAIGDFNGDGKQDMAITNYTSNTVSVLLANNTGGFNATAAINVGTNPRSIAAGDFNGDGKQDLAIADNSNSISVLLGAGNEINVQGNGTDISDSDNSPAAADNTDFGIANNVTHTFSIYNTGMGYLHIDNINMSGADASLFSISGINLPVSIPAGGSVDFMVSFTPLRAGTKTATVHIINNDCDESDYDFAVKGIFDCPPVDVSFTGLGASYCSNTTAVTLTGNHAPYGVFSGPGVTDFGNGSASFDPSLTGTSGGQYSIIYSYTDGVNDCVYSTSQVVTVNATPEVSISGLLPAYCSFDSAVILTGFPTGGVFSSSSPALSGNVFNPSQAGTGSFTIIYTYTDMNGCSNSSLQPVSVNECLVTLNLHVLLEGFSTAPGMMAATKFDLGISEDPTETDDITVNLWSENSLASAMPDYATTAVLHTNGNAYMQFPFSANGNSYYIAVRHRNSIETWSKLPVTFNGSTVYDFSTGLDRAYDDGVVAPMKEVGAGLYAMYAGDINQDGAIDGQDMNTIDNEVGFFGYNISDVNGDGATDGQDMNYVDNNSQLGLFFARPY